MTKNEKEEETGTDKEEEEREDTDVSHNNRNRITKLSTTPRTRCIITFFFFSVFRTRTTHFWIRTKGITSSLFEVQK